MLIRVDGPYTYFINYPPLVCKPGNQAEPVKRKSMISDWRDKSMLIKAIKMHNIIIEINTEVGRPVKIEDINAIGGFFCSGYFFR